MININYFSNSRLEIYPLIFHFLKKIKTENKKNIKLNILTTQDKIDFFEKYIDEDLNTVILTFNNGFNYTEKLKYVLELDSEYSIKLDEDCIINNHIWDYMIENCGILNDENNLLLSPLLSTTLPSCDEFINEFLSNEEGEKIKKYFLSQEMPNGLFNVDYSPLNKYTIYAKEWIPNDYYKGLSELKTNIKGMHPMRISYNAQTNINDFILDNYQKLLNKNQYSIFEINSPYFTNNLFLIKTNTWKNIFNLYGSIYDEIPISDFKNKYNKRFMFIKNGFGIHTMYNTIYGNNNKWNIGGMDSEEKELAFISNLKKIIL
jgi:hypothetical protein